MSLIMAPENRNEHLIELSFNHYRETGFPYPCLSSVDRWQSLFAVADKHVAITQAQKSLFDEFAPKNLEITHDGTAAANSFHEHIWHSYAKGMRSPIAAYEDDKALRKACRMTLEETGKINDLNVRRKLRIVNGTQMCSNFRPVAARAIYQKFWQGRTPYVLDPSMGYGGRLLGFIASGIDAMYVGTDPSTQSYQANVRMADFYGATDNVRMMCSPFEDTALPIPPGSVDLAFTSPPYFTKEIYSDEPTQSSVLYPEYPAWRSYFLEPLIEKCHKYLMPGGNLVLNVADISIKNTIYPLLQDTLAAAANIGFTHVDTYFMRFPGFGKNLKKIKTEPLLILQKSGEHND